MLAWSMLDVQQMSHSAFTAADESYLVGGRLARHRPEPLFCSQLPHPSITDQSLGLLIPETQGQGLQAGGQSHGSDLLEQRIGLMTFL